MSATEQETSRQVPEQEQQTHNISHHEDTSAGQVIIIPNTSSDPSQQDFIEYSIFGKKMPFDILTLAYSLAVAIGGIYGYAAKGSVPSITSGLIFGLIILVGGFLEAKYKNHYLLIGASATLFGFMSFRAFKAYKFFPAGPVALISLFMLLRYSYFTYLRIQRRSRTQ